MPLNILQKRQELEALAAQIASMQKEVEELEHLNPDFSAQIAKLKKTKENILKELSAPIHLSIPKLVTFECFWNGINEWPITSNWKFEFDESTNQILETLIINDDSILKIFEGKHESVDKIKTKLTALDNKILKHNKEVNEAFKTYEDEAILDLAIEQIVE
jgi:hypothetical protein